MESLHARHLAGEPVEGIDAFVNQPRSLENEGGIDLYEAGSGADLFDGILRAGDPADPDDRDPAAELAGKGADDAAV